MLSVESYLLLSVSDCQYVLFVKCQQIILVSEYFHQIAGNYNHRKENHSKQFPEVGDHVEC